MLRFRSFKATFTISKSKPSNLVHYDDSPGVSLTGAYRTNKDELYANINYPDPPKKITPSMVVLPASQSENRKDISKSTNNLSLPIDEKVNITKSTPNISEGVSVPLTKNQIKEQKKLEKNNLNEQKKQAKIAAKEQKKAEKVNITKNAPNISEAVPEQLTRTQIEEQKKFEKNNLNEQKNQAKIAAKEQKNQAKIAAKEQKKAEKGNITENAPNISEAVPETLTRTQIEEQKKLEKNNLNEQKNQAKIATKEQERAEKGNITESTPNITQAVPETLTRTQIKEQKKMEKKHLDEQKKQAKLAAKEQERAEKLRKEREKQMQKSKAEEKKKPKREAPPHPRPGSEQTMPEVTTPSERPHTNTLESSISQSSGPPPYSPKDTAQENNRSDQSSDVTFPEEDSSWDLVSQHRQQINRPQVVKSIPKQTHLDLNYNVGPKSDTDNTEALM